MKCVILLLVVAVGLGADSSPLDDRLERLQTDLRQQLAKEFDVKLEKKEQELRSHFQEQVDAVTKELIRLQEERHSDKEELERRVSELDEELTERDNEVDILRTEIIELNSQITATQSQVAAILSNLAAVQSKLLGLIVMDKQHTAVLDQVQDQLYLLEQSAVNVTRIQSAEDLLGKLQVNLGDLNSSMAGQKCAFLVDLSEYDNHPSSGVEFDRVQYDPYGVYDPSCGCFTAPWDGVYHFYSQMYVQPSDTTGMWTFLEVDGQNAAYSRLTAHTTDYDQTLTLVTDLYLRAGQTVAVHVYCVDYVYGVTANHMVSWFGGHLIE